MREAFGVDVCHTHTHMHTHRRPPLGPFLQTLLCSASNTAGRTHYIKHTHKFFHTHKHIHE